MKIRDDNQIILDAYEAEKRRLSRLLEKTKKLNEAAINAPSRIIKLREEYWNLVHNTDISDHFIKNKLKSIVKEESELLKLKEFDISKETEKETVYQLEYDAICSIIKNHRFLYKRHN